MAARMDSSSTLLQDDYRNNFLNDTVCVIDVPMVPPVQTTERRSGLREVIEEVVRTAQAIQREEESVHEMIHDHTVDLVRAIRANAKLKEMKAYLSGLKFQLLRQSQ